VDQSRQRVAVPAPFGPPDQGREQDQDQYERNAAVEVNAKPLGERARAVSVEIIPVLPGVSSICLSPCSGLTRSVEEARRPARRRAARFRLPGAPDPEAGGGMRRRPPVRCRPGSRFRRAGASVVRPGWPDPSAPVPF
jgi:hypothetical protein